MNKRTIVLLYALLILALSVPAVSWTEPARGEDRPADMSSGGPMRPDDGERARPEGRRGGPPSKERMEQMRKRVEMVRMWKLTETLDLDEKTALKLFPVLRKYDEKKVELQRERYQITRKMRRVEKGSEGEKVDAKKLLADMDKNRAAMVDLEKAQRDELGKILTPEQMVKYIAFEESFRREMQQMLRESRGGREGGKRQPGVRGRDQDSDRGGPPSEMEEEGAPPERMRR